MKVNPVVQTMLDHKSIREYSDKIPPDDVVEAVLRAGQQAPFAYQARSVLLSRNRERNPWHAPLLFTICVDYHKFELIMQRRSWTPIQNDVAMLLLGVQDAAYMAENMVVAGRSFGLGSCFLGNAMYRADRIAKEYELPLRVFPFVQLGMGYPSEDPPTRPRYPLEFAVFEDKYPELSEEQVSNAMKQMDEGYLAQDYYRKARYMISLGAKQKETFTFDTYSWTEHISRKLGLWNADPKGLLEQLQKCGFNIRSNKQRVRKNEKPKAEMP